MKLGKKNMLLVSFMLFSLFFGAGNLIFPPFLGQMASENMPVALLGFLVTAVVLPVLGVVVVAKFNGLDKLASKVNPAFAVVFTILIYLSIGPGLGIPRAASVPFEMAIAPYMPEGASFAVFMLLYSSVFFAIATWLCLTPSKLVNRIGKFLSPTMLILLFGLFLSFVFGGEVGVAPAQGDYATAPVFKGFLEGYNTMDAIAALNFGLVIATTLRSMNVTEEKSLLRYTVFAGLGAGTILSSIYAMLAFMGMNSSALYPLADNGAWTLRCVTAQLFGGPGAVFLAAVFTLACLTTCVGLITSISQYFSTLTKKLSYRTWVLGIAGFSFLVCNQGLNTILSISVPVLNAIYPVAIVLIVMGLTAHWFENNPYAFPVTVGATAVIAVFHAVEGLGVNMGVLSQAAGYLPLYSYGMGWICVAVVAFALSYGVWGLKRLASKPATQTQTAPQTQL